MAGDREDIATLTKTVYRLAKAVEGMSNTGNAHHVRYGRGGDSNRTGADATEYSKEKFRKSLKTLDKQVNDTEASLTKWKRAIKDASGISKMFGESVQDSIDRIKRTHKDQSRATDKITSEMVKLVQTQGIYSSTVQKGTRTSLRYVDALDKLTKASDEKAQAEKRLVEIDTKLSSLRSKKKGRLLDQETKETIKKLEAEKESMKALSEYDKEMRDASDTIKALNKTIDKNTMPAFEGLDQATEDLITAKGNEAIGVKEAAAGLKILTPRVKAQANTVSEVMKSMTGLHQSVDKLRHAMAETAMSAVKEMAPAVKSVINNFREQLKYNVKDSNYTQAAVMGMSEAQMSQFLGSNIDVMRGSTGSANNAAILDDNVMKDLHRTALTIYGEGGLGGANRVAQAMKVSQQAGISTRDNPGIVDARLRAMSDMADRVGMVKGELMDFTEALADSGDMAYLSTKYNSLSDSQKMQAIDQELEARIANAKMLGLSTEHVKRQIQLEKNARHAGIQEQLMNMIGGTTLVNQAKNMGINVSPEVEEAYRLTRMGLGTDEQRTQATMFERMMQEQHLGKVASARDRGDMNESMRLAAERTVYSNLGNESVYGQDGLNEALSSGETAKSRWGEAYNHFLQTGEISDTMRKEMDRGGDSSDQGSYNSSLLPFGLDQTMNKAFGVYEGLEQNPMFNIAKNVGSILKQTIMMNLQLLKLNTMGAGRMGRGGGFGGMATGRGALKGGALKSNFSKVIRNPLLKFGAAPLGGALGAYTAGTDAYAEDQDLGKALTVGGAAGAGAGLGIWGGAAAGATVGAVGGPVGILIGGLVGSALGAWAGSSLGKEVGEGLHGMWDRVTGDTLTQKESKMEQELAEAKDKEKEASAKKEQEQSAYLQRMVDHTGKLVDINDEQLGEARKGNRQYQSVADMENQLRQLDGNRAAKLARLQSS